ncbi:MAG: cell division protein FtsL [Gammaproteobacteria bacterium]|nr:cell division protein FtsL [Gammaproteobacteria bacterium]
MKVDFAIVCLLLVANVATALLVVGARHENRREFIVMQGLQAERDELEVDWGRLQLEQSAWATHGRIEQLAREQLNMQIPAEADIVVLRRAQ